MSIPNLSTVLVAATLVLSSVSKLVNLKWFISKVEKYSKIRGQVAWVIGTIIVLTEFGVGLWMLTSTHRMQSAYAAMALFGFFTVVVTVNLIARNSGECGCFPFLPTLRFGWRLMVRNIGLSLLAWLSMSPVSVKSTESFIFGTIVFMILCTLEGDLIPDPKGRAKVLAASLVSS